MTDADEIPRQPHEIIDVRAVHDQRSLKDHVYRRTVTETAMLYLSNGRADVSRRLHLTLPLMQDVSRLNRFTLRQQICDAMLATILDDASPDSPVYRYVDIDIVAGLGSRKIPFRAPFRLHVSFDPAEFTPEVDRPREDSSRDTLRRIIENDVDRLWKPFCIDRFIEDVQTAESCLRVLDGESRPVDWVLGALQTLEPILLCHGHDLDDAVDLNSLRMPMPDEAPAALRAPGVLRVDSMGLYLLIDSNGCLQVRRLRDRDFDGWCDLLEAAALASPQAA